MEEQDLLAVTIGKNLTKLRKAANMTQLELAEKLNYSDKSVSKWEQGNGIPDVRILVQLAALYGVSVDDLLREHKEKRVIPEKERKHRNFVTTLISVGLCWLVAVIAFVAVGIFFPTAPNAWLAFVYAVPVSAIVTLVLSCVWGYKTVRIVSLSVLIWSVLATVFLTALVFGKNVWLIFLVGIPLQILALFYFVWRKGAKWRI